MSTTTHTTLSEWLDARRFEEVFSLSRRTMFSWIADGRLAAYRPSKRKTLLERQDVEKLLEASRSVCALDKIVDETVAEVLGQ